MAEDPDLSRQRIEHQQLRKQLNGERISPSFPSIIGFSLAIRGTGYGLVGLRFSWFSFSAHSSTSRYQLQ